MSGSQISYAPGEAQPVQGCLPAPVAGAAAQHPDGYCLTCQGSNDHDEWNAGARGETPLQRVDRAYGEILQEIRVAQTGVQILFAFLLALAFTTRFATITRFQRDLYVLTLMLSAGSAALLIAPAAYHRMVYRRRLKQHLVQVANRLALSGLAMLLLAITSALLLILDVVLGRGPALLLGTGALTWFVAWWFALPAWSRLRHLGLINAPGASELQRRSPAGPNGLHGPDRRPEPQRGTHSGSPPGKPAATGLVTGQDAASTPTARR